VTLTLIVLAGMMGASGIVLAAAAAHAAPGAGLDSAAYMLLLHATAVLSGVALLQLGLLLRPLMFVILAAWVLGVRYSLAISRCALSLVIAYLHWQRRPAASSL
jgi:hypothetical protein